MEANETYAPCTLENRGLRERVVILSEAAPTLAPGTKANGRQLMLADTPLSEFTYQQLMEALCGADDARTKAERELAAAKATFRAVMDEAMSRPETEEFLQRSRSELPTDAS